MSDYTRNAKYQIVTHNRWGYSTGTICGNNKKELATYVQDRYMPWLSKRVIMNYIMLNN